MTLKDRREKQRRQRKYWEAEKDIILDEIALKEQKKQIKSARFNEFKKISASKKIMLFLLINCTLIELFTGYITVKDLQLATITGTVDFSPIVALISAVVGQVIGFAIYAAKSTKENTQGGITYQAMMNEYNKKDIQG